MTKNIKLARETLEQMYLDRDQIGDVTFLVETQRIHAHRNVLAAFSPKYKAQFYGPHRDGGVIRVPDVSAAAFNVFLQFFYKETVDLTMDNIEAVMDLVQQSLVDEFNETCVNFLKIQIKANHFCVAYRLADLYEIETLRLDCEQRITKNTMDIFASEDFLRCDHEMLLKILKMDTLNCNEADVFTACIAWAREQCKLKDKDDGKPENLRAELSDASYQIRFSSFTAEEFAISYNSMEGFFTADELAEILYMIGKLKDFKSQKFNATPRNKKPEEHLIGALWQQELDLLVSTQKSTFFTNVGHVEFSFSCSNPIRLHGIALGIQFSEAELMNFPKTLSVRALSDIASSFGVDHSRLQFVPMKCKVYTAPTRTEETLIIFEKPIERVVKFTCAIQPPLKPLTHKFVLHQSVQAGSTGFKFSGDWVTRICFDNYAA